MQRRLEIDGRYDSHECDRVEIVSNTEEIRSLCSYYMNLSLSPSVLLDCTRLESYHFNHFLKFFEDYRGDLIVVVNDPIPSTVVSRFSDVVKNLPKDNLPASVSLKDLWKVRLDRMYLSKNMKESVSNLLNIELQ